ncbi:recombinase family protein [Burkholderia sp. SCN-KJ]|uniref:recombinase family protein n=1 Tax=Burkholderia sp. SCN-KJ TaxID=2969248 RepID=UPI00214FFACF|nr:recombinase family protein [Burkholderia sp. SCN-KJ]MCR4471806.1 recombinase family protein [Burkholderia sp. SCN-KJ]
MASLRTSVEHLIRNIDEFVLARVRRYRGKSKIIALVNHLNEQCIGIMPLTETIDTQSSAGCLFLHMMTALADFARSLGSKRT